MKGYPGNKSKPKLYYCTWLQLSFIHVAKGHTVKSKTIIRWKKSCSLDITCLKVAALTRALMSLTLSPLAPLRLLRVQQAINTSTKEHIHLSLCCCECWNQYELLTVSWVCSLDSSGLKSCLAQTQSVISGSQWIHYELSLYAWVILF